MSFLAPAGGFKSAGGADGSRGSKIYLFSFSKIISFSILESYKLPMIIGLIIGGILLVLLIAIVIAVLVFLKRRKAKPIDNRSTSSMYLLYH